MSDDYFLNGHIEEHLVSETQVDFETQFLTNYQTSYPVDNNFSYNNATNNDPVAKTNDDVVFYRVNGSEEVYGLQKVFDDDGNEQKCQFQVREASNGQFEPIPETIQVLPYDEEFVEEDRQAQEFEHIFFKEEYLGLDQSQATQPELTSQLESAENFICDAAVPLNGGSDNLLDTENVFLDPDVNLGDEEEVLQEPQKENVPELSYNALVQEAIDDEDLQEGEFVQNEPYLEPAAEESTMDQNEHLHYEATVVLTDQNNQQFSYVVGSTGKENVNNSGYKINPRSILKTSVLGENYQKAEQSRCQTKILEAPVRTERLPRKQKIEVVERSGDEIVLQQIVVSSNGYMRITQDGVLKEKKLIVPEEYVQLSDSDEEARVKRRKKKGKRPRKKRKVVEITISDSEDENRQ